VEQFTDHAIETHTHGFCGSILNMQDQVVIQSNPMNKKYLYFQEKDLEYSWDSDVGNIL
jgi:hypothetical protein